MVLSLRSAPLISRYLPFLSLSALWAPIIWLIGAQWTVYEQYHYGWAVPFLCVYLAWRKAREVDQGPGTRDQGPAAEGGGRRAEGSGETLPRSSTNNPPPDARTLTSPATGLRSWFREKPAAWALTFLLLCLLLPARILQEANPLWRLASYLLAGTAIALTLLLLRAWKPSDRSKWPFAFPVLFFFVAIPWPTPIEGWIVHSLATLNTSAVMEVLGLIGIPAVQHGNVIEVSQGMVGIDEACSGIRSLQATFMIALFLGEYYRLAARPRALLCLGGVAMAGVLNLARTLILVLVADRSGLEAMGRWHDPTGIGILLGCFSGLWLLACLFQRLGSDGRKSAPSEPFRSGGRESTDSGAAPSSVRPAPGGFGIEPTALFSRQWRALAWTIMIGSVVTVAGTELWFRLHETRHETAQVEWSAAPPPGAQRLPISAEVKRQLLYDDGVAAMWLGSGPGAREVERPGTNDQGPGTLSTPRPEDGGEESKDQRPEIRDQRSAERFNSPDVGRALTSPATGGGRPDSDESSYAGRWQLFYFRWNPAYRPQDRARVQLARSHRPEICLPASGRRLRAELPPVQVNVNGMVLPFRVYNFVSGERSLFVFYSVVEDGAETGRTANMREDHWARLRAAWRGSRGLGQRVVEVALWNARDAAQAMEWFKAQLPRLIVVAAPRESAALGSLKVDR